MIALVADPEDKEGKKTKIIGMYVPMTFKDTQKLEKDNKVELELKHSQEFLFSCHYIFLAKSIVRNLFCNDP